jgi:hypothetical protein
MIARNHVTLHAMPGRQPDMQFVDEMGSLMIWGTENRVVAG